MLKIIVLIIIGLLPSLWSLWILRKKQRYIRNRNRRIVENYTPIREYIRPIESESDYYYLEGVGYLIGDISCKFNARSGYMRCAVNPSGPCGNCRHYESKEFTNIIS
ncbi:MAG: hypothetical protein F6K61_21260 [Sphaerospermopsis sp. SIO1G1]|nr:hypothetical protein [Sphaerospermopsis sp. SIO1G1]